jgi:hypothetical protein
MGFLRCAFPGCAHPVGADAPISLCERHLAVAADWSARTEGVTDLLPSPCLLCGSRVGVHYPTGWICAICEWRAGESPDGELPPPRVDVVYYLRNGDRMKIGTTGNPRQRFAAIWHEEVVAFERGTRVLEQQRHQQFAADRFTGSEWFRLTKPLQRHVESLRQGVEDPWSLYARWTSEAIALRN